MPAGTPPPVRIFAPDAFARSTKPLTRSRCAAEISGPICTSSSNCPPILTARIASTIASSHVVHLALLDVDARRGGAVLPGVKGRGQRGNRRHLIDIHVVKDDERRFAAQFEMHALERIGGGLHDLLARPGRSGQADHAHVGMLDQRLPGVVAARDHVEHAVGDSGFGASSASISAVIGVVGAGLSTTVQPAASAGPIFQIAISSG